VPLDRHQRVARIWDWLPAFRAAAEYENLQRASLALAVSPSALSRSIKLLEEALEISLFARTPGGLKLTDHGRRLLIATREAMRQIHSGVPNVAPNRLNGGAAGPAFQPLLCEAMLAALPDWTLSFADVAPVDAGESLRCGDLDLVLAHAPLPGPDLRVEALPALEFALAIGPGGDRTKVASLQASGLSWPDAALMAANLDQLIRLAEEAQVAVFAPLYAVPRTWTVLESFPAQPAFLIVRAYADAPPLFVASVLQALTARLTAKGGAV